MEAPEVQNKEPNKNLHWYTAMILELHILLLLVKGKIDT